jgi:hypothetical protein
MTKGDMGDNLSGAAANLKQATAQLNQIASDIHGLTSSPQVQADIKTTVHNVAQVSGQTQQLVSKLDAITSGHFGTAGKGSPKFEGRLDFTQNFRTDKFRTDLDLYAPLSSTDFASVGVYDLTGANTLNLQYGVRAAYNSPLDYRAGVYAGKVAVGADYDLFGPDTLSFDLYDPNRLRLDARLHVPLDKQLGFWFGVEDVPRTNGVTLGVELRR